MSSHALEPSAPGLTERVDFPKPSENSIQNRGPIDDREPFRKPGQEKELDDYASEFISTRNGVSENHRTQSPHEATQILQNSLGLQPQIDFESLQRGDFSNIQTIMFSGRFSDPRVGHGGRRIGRRLSFHRKSWQVRFTWQQFFLPHRQPGLRNVQGRKSNSNSRCLVNESLPTWVMDRSFEALEVPNELEKCKD